MKFPLHLSLIAHSFKGQTIATKLFYALLIGAAMLLFSKCIFPASTKTFSRQFHLNSSSYTEWALLQTLPAMYNFSNEFWYTPYPYDEETMDDIEAGALDEIRHDAPFSIIEHYYINHYPLRLLTFNLNRRFFAPEDEEILAVYVRSNYQGISTLSAYEVHLENNTTVLTLKNSRVGKALHEKN